MSVTAPSGFRAAGATAGIKPSGKPDLALIVRDAAAGGGAGGGTAPIAGSAMVFTRNALIGAPVEIGRRVRAAVLAGTAAPVRAVLVNAGNSNAATGEPGVRDARACMAAVAAMIGAGEEEVLPSSTGVIGRLLPTQKIIDAIPGLVASLARGRAADEAAAGAIMTTDLVPKTALRTAAIGGATITIGAIAKGSGMIAPRLDTALGSAAHPPAPAATMLAFITTDAPIASCELQLALESCSAESFDRISVDNHPSCSDTVVVMSSGMAEGGRVPRIAAGTPAFAAFAAALGDVCRDLAEQIVTDGEGATRIFKVNVRGAKTAAEAERMAREVVNSPLVKCAIHGRDPNWGRIVTAAGNAGVPFDPREASLTIGPVEVYKAGVPVMAALEDARLKPAMAAKRVECVLTVGRGEGAAWMIGCDLSAQYVSINADYTT